MTPLESALIYFGIELTTKQISDINSTLSFALILLGSTIAWSLGLKIAKAMSK